MTSSTRAGKPVLLFAVGLMLMSAVCLSGCASGPRDLFAKVWPGKSETAAEEEIEIAEKESIGSRIKGWFSRENDGLKAEDDPLFEKYAYEDLEPGPKAATQESNGAVSLTSAEDIEKSDIRKAASEKEAKLTDFLADDALDMDQGPFSTIDRIQVGHLDDFEEDIEAEATEGLSQDYSDKGGFASSFDEEMSRIGQEVVKEQKESQAEIDSIRAEFAKLDAMEGKSEESEKESVSATDETGSAPPFPDFGGDVAASEEAEEQPLSFGSSDSNDGKMETVGFDSNEFDSGDFGQKESVFSDHWAESADGFESTDTQFDELESDAWVSKEEVDSSTQFSSTSTTESVSESAVDNEWIESQPVRPNPAYQQESGRMIFDSKSVPSRFMTPDEKENWFRQTKLDRAGKKNRLGANQELGVDGNESVIKMVSGVNAVDAAEIEELETSDAPEFVIEAEPAPETTTVKLGQPLWNSAEEDSSTSSLSVPEFGVTEQVEEEAPAFAVSTFAAPSFAEPVEETSPIEETEESESAPAFEVATAPAFDLGEMDSFAADSELPDVEWGDLPAEEEVVAVGADGTTIANVSMNLPGRWLGIALSLGTICYLLIRRRTPPARVNSTN